MTEFPDFTLSSLGAVRMKDGKTAVVWKATTTLDGKDYSLMGPVRSGGLPHSPYVNDVDAAREFLEERLIHRMVDRLRA